MGSVRLTTVPPRLTRSVTEAGGVRPLAMHTPERRREPSAEAGTRRAASLQSGVVCSRSSVHASTSCDRSVVRRVSTVCAAVLETASARARGLSRCVVAEPPVW